MNRRQPMEQRYARDFVARELSSAEESLRRAVHHVRKAETLKIAAGETLPGWAHALLDAHDRLERTR